jgi:hypothetical protein
MIEFFFNEVTTTYLFGWGLGIFSGIAVGWALSARRKIHDEDYEHFE